MHNLKNKNQEKIASNFFVIKKAALYSTYSTYNTFRT